jgi:hypothetical protein
MRLDLLAQTGATFALVGLIWTVQLVQYPLFARVGEESFRAFHSAHARRITWIVAPLMAIELGTALWLVGVPHESIPPVAAWVGLVLVVVNWLSTAFLQVPQHRRLAAGFEPAAHAFLVRSNWVRTLAWSLRGVLCLWFVSRVVA